MVKNARIIVLNIGICELLKKYELTVNQTEIRSFSVLSQ